MPDEPTAPDPLYAPGRPPVEWDLLAADYIQHRAGWPAAFFEWLDELGVLRGGLVGAELGCGPGPVAAELARRGLRMLALDPTHGLLRAARARGLEAVRARGENLPLAGASLDLVIAPSSFGWMEGGRAAAEMARVLRPGAFCGLAHLIWRCDAASVGDTTARCLEDAGAGSDQRARTGLYPQWAGALRRAGFEEVRDRHADLLLPYSREHWRGRIRASVPVCGRMSPQKVRAFDAAHDAALRAAHGEGLLHVPHRLFLAWGYRARN